MVRKIECEICKQDIGINGLSLHLKQKHNIKTEHNTKWYYNTFIKNDNEGICKHKKCSNDTNFISFNKGYFEHCSKNALKNNVIYQKEKE